MEFQAVNCRCESQTGLKCWDADFLAHRISFVGPNCHEYSRSLSLVVLSYYCCRLSQLRNGIAIYDRFSPWYLGRIVERKWELPWELYLNCSLCCQYLFFTFIVWMMKIKSINKNMEGGSMPFLVFRRDHLRSTSGIICGSGSFAVQFEDYFRSGDHLRSGIICGAVQLRYSGVPEVLRYSRFYIPWALSL